MRQNNNRQLEDVYEVYAAYWINETVIEDLWRLYANNNELLDLIPLLEDIQKNLQIQNSNERVQIYSTYYMKEAIIVSIYN